MDKESKCYEYETRKTADWAIDGMGNLGYQGKAGKKLGMRQNDGGETEITDRLDGSYNM